MVYGSVLVDEGRYAEALEVVSARLHDDPTEHDLRRWYVAARAAALAGDGTTARRLRDAIIAGDPGFPGFDELDAAISGRG